MNSYVVTVVQLVLVAVGSFLTAHGSSLPDGTIENAVAPIAEIVIGVITALAGIVSNLWKTKNNEDKIRRLSARLASGDPDRLDRSK